MSKINLLPWREELKKVRNRIFYSILGGAIVLSVIIVVLGDSYLNYRINVENANIGYINQELKDAKEQVGEVQKLRENKKQLLARMSIIQSLQGDRTSVVKLLDIIPRLIPEGLYLTLLSRKEMEMIEEPGGGGDQFQTSKKSKKKEMEIAQKKYIVIIQGVALTNGSISIFLKKLEAVKWLSEVKLNEVSINKEGSGLNFNLGFVQNVTVGE